MKTIDEMLSEVAEIVGAAPVKSDLKPTTNKTEAEPKPIHTEKVEDIENMIKIEKSEIKVSKIVMKPVLSLALAKEIVYCIEKGAALVGVDVVVAVVNDGGQLIMLEAMDNSFVASVCAAQDKAYTAAALKMPTHVALQESRGGALDGYTNGNGILMLGGGYPVEVDGKVIGAIGVSGGTKDQDMLLANIGIEYFKQRIKTL